MYIKFVRKIDKIFDSCDPRVSLHKFEKERACLKYCPLYLIVQFIFLAKMNLKESILVSNKVKIGQE